MECARASRSNALAKTSGGCNLRHVGRASEHSDLTPSRICEALLFILPAPIIVALLLRPFGLADLGWQLKLGELMVREGTPFLSERFVVKHLGEALIPNAWLSQVLFSQIYTLGGWIALRACDALLWGAGLFVAAIPARRREAPPLAILLALIAGFVVALPSAGIRPQSFAALAFALMLILIQKPDRRSLYLAAPLFILWQNLHPSVTLAVLVSGAVAALQWLQYFRGKGLAPITMSALCVIALASVFATPAGISIVYLASHNTTASLLAGASEWFPLWHPINQRFLWPVIFSAMLAAVAIYKARPPVAEWVPAVLTLFMSIIAARFILFYAIASIPLLARLPIGHSIRTTGARIFGALSAIIVAVALATMPVRIKPELPPDGLRAIDRMGGTIYSDPAFGGAIIHENPNAKVSHDGRFYLYSVSELNNLRRTASDGSMLAKIERDYDPSAFALARFRSPALIRELEAHPELWRMVYSDQGVALFLRR